MTVNNNNTNSSVSEKTLHEVESAVGQAIRGYPDGALARLTKNCALNGEQTKAIKDILNTFKPDGVTTKSQNLKNRILDELNHKGRCFALMNELPKEIIIHEIFIKCFLTDDPRSLQTLACTNKTFNQIVTQFANGLNLDELCPSLMILGAALQILDKLNHKGRCFALMNELPKGIIIQEIFIKCFLTDDPRSLQTLACTNKRLNQIVTQFANGLNLDELCPSLRILDAALQNITVDDEPIVVPKNWTG